MILFVADVGIVMPVYKQDDSIFKAAIDSILNQNYRNFLLVIVIDGVTPNVVNIANHYAKKDKRIRLIPRIYNNGTASALNIGFNFLMKQNNIKYLTWVSSDNIYYPNFLYVLRKQLINAPPEVGLAYSSFRFINAEGKPFKHWDFFFKHQDQPKENLVNVYFVGYSFMYKKTYAQKIEGYQYTPVEDYDYFLRLTEHCEITFVPQKLMEFRIEAPYSNSIQIKNSNEKRRRRRYLMHFVMTEARKRRNISPELTIIFPVGDSSELSKQALELVLDQSFSNHRLIIHDISSKQEFLPVTNEIPDVRMQYFSTPNGVLRDVLLKSLELVETKYVLFFQVGSFRDSIHLAEMMYSANSNPLENQVLGENQLPEFGKVYSTDYISSLLQNNNLG